MNSLVEIFTDGACRGNPGPGGWGALLRYGTHEKRLCGGEANTTNNRMELLAVIMALEALTRPCQVRVTTDSRYVQHGMTEWIHRWLENGWRTADSKPVKNIDLWQRLHVATQRHQIEWQWTKGHNDHLENTLADELAHQGINKTA